MNWFWKQKKSSELNEPRLVEDYSARCEVLIVEDKEDEAHLLERLFSVQGAVSHIARNIVEALERVNSPSRYHLALVDLTLPNGSGIEIIRRIVECRRMTHVIVVSGSIEKIPLVLGYGYVGLLGKPYTTDSIRRILWVHRLPRAD